MHHHSVLWTTRGSPESSRGLSPCPQGQRKAKNLEKFFQWRVGCRAGQENGSWVMQGRPRPWPGPPAGRPRCCAGSSWKGSGMVAGVGRGRPRFWAWLSYWPGLNTKPQHSAQSPVLCLQGQRSVTVSPSLCAHARSPRPPHRTMSRKGTRDGGHAGSSCRVQRKHGRA